MLFDQINRELELTQRHLIVLKKVIESGPIGILKLAEETEMPTHKVRYSLRVLELEQLIKPSASGAIAGKQVEEFISDFDDELENIVYIIERIREIGKSI
ncbi:MAG: hypothetical protein P1P69_09745 [Methanosarcinaceae archaeon]|nr:hypothetical protein [Methanosarcinaceae archaeon]MCL7411745.1 hypothetical protein [Methanosarcinaceae archaeon]MDF1534764.1 hypothetical protein [Methanosarcinaceae archaeon]